jgi:hypothetical protein
VGADIDAFDEQLHNARLLSREQFVPEQTKRSSASRTSASEMSLVDCRAARQVRTTISGARSKPRSWSMTAFSISAAGTRPMG